jgi:hypothetical protein
MFRILASWNLTRELRSAVIRTLLILARWICSGELQYCHSMLLILAGRIYGSEL